MRIIASRTVTESYEAGNFELSLGGQDVLIDFELVECERSVHEITVAATAPLRAINEMLHRVAMDFIL